MSTEADIRFMREALTLAESMHGMTSPDPMVGAVIVNDGELVGRGYHAQFATPHAETFAIKNAGEKARFSTLYVNLEPCCHHGNNPPCTSAIISAGISRVVAAIEDPNPLVSGKGFSELRAAGIKVDFGILEEEAKQLNESFIKYITTNRPFVILKSAMSLDGKIATKTGDSFWITGMEARKYVHQVRSHVDAVMVGIGTVLKDNPWLSVRDADIIRKNPYKIVLDGSAKIPLDSHILSFEPQNTIVVVTKSANAKKIGAIKKTGADVIVQPTSKDIVDLDLLMIELGSRKITSILLEGGGKISASAVSAEIVDKLMYIISSKIIGGADAPTPIEGAGIEKLSQAINIRNVITKRLGDDILVEGYVMR